VFAFEVGTQRQFEGELAHGFDEGTERQKPAASRQA
jgi:hypothetical protein